MRAPVRQPTRIVLVAPSDAGPLVAGSASQIDSPPLSTETGALERTMTMPIATPSPARNARVFQVVCMILPFSWAGPVAGIASRGTSGSCRILAVPLTGGCRRYAARRDHERVDGDAAVRAADHGVRVERLEVVAEIVRQPRAARRPPSREHRRSTRAGLEPHPGAGGPSVGRPSSAPVARRAAASRGAGPSAPRRARRRRRPAPAARTADRARSRARSRPPAAPSARP